MRRMPYINDKPTGKAIANLEKIQINDTIYQIPQPVKSFGGIRTNFTVSSSRSKEEINIPSNAEDESFSGLMSITVYSNKEGYGYFDPLTFYYVATIPQAGFGNNFYINYYAEDGTVTRCRIDFDVRNFKLTYLYIELPEALRTALEGKAFSAYCSVLRLD